MNCTSCGANLPSNAATCPLCGTPAPYNVNSSSGSSPYSGAPPPSTAYGPPSYGTPPPPNPYEAPPPQQQNYYATPPLPPQSSYVAPPQQPGGGMYAPQYPPQLPPQRRSRLPLILGIIALVFLVACAGISFAVYQGLKQTGSTITSSLDATATSIVATATTITNTPAKTIDPAAAAIIKNPQTSSAIDKDRKST